MIALSHEKPKNIHIKQAKDDIPIQKIQKTFQNLNKKPNQSNV